MRIIVSINLHTKDESPLMLEDEDISYKDLLEKVGLNNKYILTVGDNTNDTNTYVNVIKATDEEIEELW